MAEEQQEKKQKTPGRAKAAWGAIKPTKSPRDEVKMTPAQKIYAMPPPGNTIIVGGTGSGKSTILANLLNNPAMLKGYYDRIFLICLSPAPTISDAVKAIKKRDIYHTDNPLIVRRIYQEQMDTVKKKGFKAAPHTLIIFDDIIQSPLFLKNEILRDIYFGGTHSKMSTYLLAQNYMSIPRMLRMNAHAAIICHGINKSEIVRIGREWTCGLINEREFDQLINYALDAPYSFIFINRTIPDKRDMYRKGFGRILRIRRGAAPGESK